MAHAKLEKVNFELARLKRWKFGAKTEAMTAQQRALFQDTLAEDEASLQAQRHALETLATSERQGCALGAATALVKDWSVIRQILDRAAARAGIDHRLPALPEASSIAQVADSVADNIAASRALTFGAEQLLLQHRALFDLLEARASARADY